ncbi:alpha/beta fold hydrolase [uncultured Microbulbifer sp.]|uniref:thioesterase II family protein n=1 Tax=uncultured Microbulbifer sp. TaxID=348147 RepID=UPI0026194C0C|nr:alpha/beta fold hydrolase [uncultured Microbulbifer sp.]
MSCAWLNIPHPKPNAAIQLLCLPHAGGTAALYRPWVKLLPDSIELVLVCLPGREQRCNEVMPADMRSLITLLGNAVTPILDRPWAVFGHSMGATVAHELILSLQCRNLCGPEHLFVSARKAPQFQEGGNQHQLDDDSLCQQLIQLGGTAPELLEIPELRALLLPTLRQDYRLIETSKVSSDQPLSCPITAMLGRDDPELTPDDARGWQRWTNCHFHIYEYTGNHFYLSQSPHLVVSHVVKQLGLT